MNNDKFFVRPLTKRDEPFVKKLDELSEDYVNERLDCPGYAWGAFLNENSTESLIGYCTTGIAEGLRLIEEHPKHTLDSILLSNVFILPEYRHKKYGSRMINETIRLRRISDGRVKPIYLMLLYDDLKNFYSPLGFEAIDNAGNMIFAEEVA